MGWRSQGLVEIVELSLDSVKLSPIPLNSSLFLIPILTRYRSPMILLNYLKLYAYYLSDLLDIDSPYERLFHLRRVERVRRVMGERAVLLDRDNCIVVI